MNDETKEVMEWLDETLDEFLPSTAAPKAKREQLESLIQTIEAAPVGSWLLNREIGATLGWTVDQQDMQGVDKWLATKGSYTQYLPDFSQSLDAALSLVPEGWVYEVASYGADNGPRAALFASTEDDEIEEYSLAFGATASTPPLAVLAAYLRSKLDG